MSQKKREVYEACDSLIKEGKQLREITIENLAMRLRELGYLRGGNKSLSKYRREWIEQQGFRSEDKDKDLSAVSAAAESLERAGERFRQSIEEEVRAGYDEKLQVYLEKQALLEEENTHLQTTLLEFSDENTELKSQLQSNADSLSAVQTSLEDTKADLIDTKARLDMKTVLLEKSEQEWKQERDAIHEAHRRQLDILSHELQEQRAQYKQGLEMQRDSHEIQRHQWVAEKDAFKTEIQKIQKTGMASTEQAAIIKNELQHQANQYLSLETQHTHLENQDKEKYKQLHLHSERIAVLTAENEKIRAYQATADHVYQMTVTQVNKTLTALQDNVTQLLARVNTLSDLHEKH